MAQGAVSIRDNVGAALRFARENWRFVLAVGGFAAAAQGLVLLFGLNPLWIVTVLLAVLAAHTALTSAALGLPRPFVNRLPGDSARVGAAMIILGALCAIVVLTVTFVAMSVLIAPYADEVRAAGEDRAAVRAITERALQSQPAALSWVSFLIAALLLALTTRFYLAAPASIERKRIVLFDSWRMTRGNFLRIVGARLLLLGPAFVFVGALQTLVAMALGAPSGDPLALINYANTNPAGFSGFYTVGIFLQVCLYSALEAGLSASFYRALSDIPATQGSTGA
jgi:hypothetical protein